MELSVIFFTNIDDKVLHLHFTSSYKLLCILFQFLIIKPWQLSLNYKNQIVLTDQLNWKIQP